MTQKNIFKSLNFSQKLLSPMSYFGMILMHSLNFYRNIYLTVKISVDDIVAQFDIDQI